jgi:hypothetical protein
MMNLRAIWAGLVVREVPSFEHPRVYGQSNLRAIPDGWRVLKQIFRERFRSPITRNSALAAGRVGAPLPVATDHGSVSMAAFMESLNTLDAPVERYALSEAGADTLVADPVGVLTRSA